MEEFAIQIGGSIRELRKLRGYTIKELADRIAACGGDEVSENVISMWELGKRRIFAEQVFYVAKALDCSPGLLFPMENLGLAEALATLPEDEIEVIAYALSKWDGNARALTLYVSLYMSLPREFRINIAKTGVLIYQICEQAGKIDTRAPEVQLDYILEQIDLIEKIVKKDAELKSMVEKM